MDDIDAGLEPAAPVWAVFGDLMAGLLGAFVVLLVGVLGIQLDLATQLEAEVKQRQFEQQRRLTLEQALAVPLATGRVTLNNGRIGISGSLLFSLNSDQLQPEGRQLLKSLVAPLAAYLGARDELLMVSGFTDDQPVRDSKRAHGRFGQSGQSGSGKSVGPVGPFADNWALSAQRALTVTRALIDEGIPSSSVFAAAFGPEQPVASNADAAGRSQNRRVEMAPLPRASGAAAQPGG